MSCIEIKDIAKTYMAGTTAEVKALSGIDLTVQYGESIALTGTLGSGKSTLLHILGLIDRPSAGSYLWNGQNVAEMSNRERAVIRNRSIGIVLQDFGLITGQTVLENVLVPMF